MRKLVPLAIAASLWSGSAMAQFCANFSDVEASDPFCPSVTWIKNRAITLGCTPPPGSPPGAEFYCPDNNVTRKQMAAFMQRLGESLFPLTCASGQVMKWNGSTWACADDANTGGGGGGTVTSISAGTGLVASPSPITTIGTLNLASTYQLPQTCPAGQVPKSNGAGAGWICGTDNTGGGTGTVTSLTAGTGITLTPSPITTTGNIAVNTATIQQRVTGSCAAGSSIRVINTDGTVTCQTDNTGATGNAFLQDGNAFAATAVLGTTDNFGLDIRVNGRRAMRLEPGAQGAGQALDSVSPNVIGGHPINFVTAGVRGATISGGGVPVGDEPAYNFEGPNRVTDIYGTIGGGYNNRAGNDGGTVADAAMATIGGGFGNVAGGFASTVGGGDINIANGHWSTIAGGINNETAPFVLGAAVGGGGNNHAENMYATIPGGENNVASGQHSFAAGKRAKTQSDDTPPITHNGAFVWADSQDFDFHSTAPNQFAARTTGGIRIVLGIGPDGSDGYTCSASDGNGWACSSDRNLKQNLRQLDGRKVLAKLSAMPVYAWNPKGPNEHVNHYGPTAQDFHATFGLGDSALRIGQQDADGVAFAALQGLNAKLEEREVALRLEILERDAEIVALKREVANLKQSQQAEIAELRRALQTLASRIGGDSTVAGLR